MTDRDKKSAPDNDGDRRDGDTVIPGRHGRHGGSLESEGAPQEQSPESFVPPKRNGDDRNRH